MSDHEVVLKRKQENGFRALEERLASLKSYINVVIEEPQKLDKKTFYVMVKAVEDSEPDCKTNVEGYIRHLEENVEMHRKEISNHD